jgi:phage virion morphogenesis protein
MASQSDQLNVWLEQLLRFRSPAFRAGLARAMQAQALELVDEGFASGMDPYGRAWPRSRAARARGGQTLRDTGRLQRSFTRDSRANADEINIGSNTEYAAIHQFGGFIRAKSAPYLTFSVRGGGAGSRGGKRFVNVKRVYLPPRPMLPLRGMPAAWRKALERAGLEYAKRNL